MLHCYNTVFQYIGKLLDIPIDMMLEERELSNIEERVARCQSALEHVEQMEKILNTRILFGKLRITDTRDLCLDVKEKTHIIA